MEPLLVHLLGKALNLDLSRFRWTDSVHREDSSP